MLISGTGSRRAATAFDREVLDEMARVGMVACCTHTGYRTARDVLEYSRNPVIFSHSNPRALFDHPRNIPDDLMLGCARTGGVVCLNGIGIFLGNNDISTENYSGMWTMRFSGSGRSMWVSDSTMFSTSQSSTNIS